MFKHKSFVINAGTKRKEDKISTPPKKILIEEPKIAVSDDKIESGKHYDENEPISLSLPESLSFSHEEPEYMGSESMEEYELSNSYSMDQNQSEEYPFSEANDYFEQESKHSHGHSYQMQSEVADQSANNTEGDEQQKQVETHEAVVMKPQEYEEDESIKEEDKKFEEDLKAILSGKKVFDKERIKNDPAEAIKDKSHGIAGNDKDNQQFESKLKNDHAIFDKIAQSMEMASSYDLGSITMDKKFDTLEKETDEDFSKKIEALLKDEDKRKNEKPDVDDIDNSKKETIDGAETKEVDKLKEKADQANEEEKIETKDFLNDLDKINEVEKSHKKEVLDELSTQSSFSSTISIKHRHLRSRVFAVSGSTVEVTIDSSWVPANCTQISELNVTLTKSIDYWPDDEKGTKKFRIGGPDTKTWNNLEPGNYYLTFFFVNNTNPHCELKGTVSVIA